MLEQIKILLIDVETDGILEKVVATKHKSENTHTGILRAIIKLLSVQRSESNDVKNFWGVHWLLQKYVLCS